MDWKLIFAELLSGRGELDVEELSAALIARGQHALENPDTLEVDTVLRQKNDHQLQEAVLYPGFTRLRARLEEAADTLVESGQRTNVAERAIAAVLHARDLCVIKFHALLSLGLIDLSRTVEGDLGEFDAFIHAHPLALESVSAFKEDALTATGLGQRSIWNQVPDFEEVEPALDESGALSERLSEEDLTLVAMGMADEVLERRVSLAIQRQPHLRELYDAILADFDALESEPSEHVPLPVSRLLPRGAHSARLAPQRLAASEQEHPRYQEPSDEDEIFVFADDSQLFVQRRPGGWVIFLYRQAPREDDAILGSGVERTWTEGRLLGAEVKPGELYIRCNGQQQGFRLDAYPE
jgi:hypothetical protein